MQHSEVARDDELKGLGARIRGIRRQRGMTLEDLSRLSKVSVAMLSHIERGRSSPSMKVLDRIRRALNISFSAFFSTEEKSPVEEERNIISRNGDRPLLHFPSTGLVKELLSPQRSPYLEMLLLHLEPGGSSGEEPWRRTGEKCGIVLTGRFELQLNESRYILEKGDAFQFDSSIPHLFRNLADTPTEIMWIIYSTELA